MTFLVHLSEIHTHYTPIKEIALDLMHCCKTTNGPHAERKIDIYIFCMFCLKSLCQYQTCPLVALLCIFPFLAGLLLSLFSRVRLCATPETAAPQAPPSLGSSRQEHWSVLPFPSPMHENEKWKWSHSVMSDSSRPHGLQPTRLLCPWGFPGKSTGVGCHCLLLAGKWH